jgi:UDP-N-acetylglucosamine pyrophosphorylase
MTDLETKHHEKDAPTNGAKKNFALSVVCISKNQTQNGGSVIFAFNTSVNQQGQPTAQKAFEYKTSDQDEIEFFKIGGYYMISIT